MNLSRRTVLGLRSIALLYLLVLLVLPISVILYRSFERGFGEFWAWITTPAAISALQLSLLIVAIVVPLNVIFGVLVALESSGDKAALEALGWVGSAILVVSLLQTQLFRLRVINLVGCLVLIAYNGLAHVWPMVGLNVDSIPEPHRLAERGW